MKLLFIAPQPFYQERGTPIAVRMALETLAADPDLTIDLLIYHEGNEIAIPRVRIMRMWVPRWLSQSWLRNIPPGLSLKKLAADLFLAAAYFSLMFRHSKSYDLIHAVEEAGFIARVGKMFFRRPYIYDMDSQLSQQLFAAWPWIRPLKRVFEAMERGVMRNAAGVVAVCDTLADYAKQAGAPEVFVVNDVSLLPESVDIERDRSTVRKELGLAADEKLILYVGNLERYQGIELLLDAFMILARTNPLARLVVVGGSTQRIANYQQQITQAGFEARAAFVGSRPLSSLPGFLGASDVLVSPRLAGTNTPMKIYSYLHAGKPLVATRLPTHTQILTEQVAFLCDPTPAAFAHGLKLAVEDSAQAGARAQQARDLAVRCFTTPVFQANLREAYRKIISVVNDLPELPPLERITDNHSPSV